MVKRLSGQGNNGGKWLKTCLGREKQGEWLKAGASREKAGKMVKNRSRQGKNRENGRKLIEEL